jgi:aspartyl-tRNA(Asn)/glutamyl-tRNA(Gln) amidotransferase subunit A
MAALGSCTGGSIRGPASLCGIVGLKATYGRVSRAGVVTLSWSQDHCGPMTWTVEDTAYMMQALAGYDPKDPTTSTAPVPDYSLSLREDIKGLTIGVPRHFFFAPHESVNPEVVATVEKGLKVLEGLGANLQEVTIPSLEYVRAANSIIMLSEAFAYHEKNLQTRPHDFGEMVRARFRIGGLFSASDYVQSQRIRKVVNRECAEVLQKVDVLVTPTMTQPAAAFEGYDATATVTGRSFTAPFNLTGLPAISVPCGFTASGLPVGMQIAGKPFDEPGVIRAAYAYQQEARWFEQRPSI